MFEDARIKLYLSSALLSALAGLASQFRAETTSIKACVAAVLYSGLSGVGFTMLCGSTVAVKYPAELLGCSIFIGLGGMKTADFVISAAQDSMAAFLRAAANKILQSQPADAAKPANERPHEP